MKGGPSGQFEPQESHQSSLLKARENRRTAVTHVASWFHLQEAGTVGREQTVGRQGQVPVQALCGSMTLVDPFPSLASVSLSDNKGIGLGKF